jgi:hypothetical protein
MEKDRLLAFSDGVIAITIGASAKRCSWRWR